MQVRGRLRAQLKNIAKGHPARPKEDAMFKTNAFKMVFLVSAVALATSGCVASHTWAPGPHQSVANFSETSGRCKLAAMGVADSEGSFAYAQGSPQFVGSYLGAVTIAGAIGAHNRGQSAYNACMEASGFVEADSTSGTANTMAPQLAAIKQQVTTCVQTARGKYPALQAHFYDLETGPSVAQMSDTTFPTADEVKLLTPYYQEVRSCNQQRIDAVSQLKPAVLPILTQGLSELDANQNLLQSRQISWGDAAKRSRVISEQTVAKVRALNA
jgi:hypothetical protein